MSKKEYIEREAALNAIKDEIENYQPNPDPYSITPYEFVRRGLNIAYSIIKTQPTADVQEVRHAEWVLQENKHPEAVCSNCGREVVYQIVNNRWEFENYCPHCGAKMDKE